MNTEWHNFFDYNDDAPTFTLFGAAQSDLQQAAAIAKGRASKSQKQYAAVRAVRLSMEVLLGRANLSKEDAAALSLLAHQLGPLELELAKKQPHRKPGRPKPTGKLHAQAWAILAVDWLTKLNFGALKKHEARKRVALQIPDMILESRKRGVKLKQIEQLGAWQDAFGREADHERKAALTFVNLALLSECKARKRSALDFSTGEVLLFLKDQLH